MSNVIKIKRGSGSDPSASDMALGEPVLRTDTAELFFKKDDGSVAKVSGGGGGPDFKYLELRNAANNGSASYPANDFTLVSAGTTTAVSPAAANTLLVSVSGVIQKPNSGTSTSGITGFIVDGSRFKTATNLPAAPDFIIYQESGGIGEPSDNTVTSAKIVDGAIVNADINASAAIAGSKINPSFTADVVINNSEPKLKLTDSDNNSDFILLNSHGNFRIFDETNTAERFKIDSSGTGTFAGNLDVGAGIDVTGNITVSGTVDGIDIATDVAANTAKVTNATHTGDVTGATSLTIANDAVTFAKLQNVASQTIFGRAGGGTGDPTALSATDVRSIINVENGATADQTKSDIDALGIAASTATTLANARTIAGVSFDGSANISLNNNAITNGAGYVTSSGNTIIGTDSDINTSGATVIDQLNMTDGVIQSHSTRTMTLADLGYTGATNANNITNNNQLTNGAGYITSAPSAPGAAKKWINFNGSNGSIRDDVGITSVTKHSTGQYTLNFDGNMANTNYSVNGFCFRDGAGRILVHVDLVSTYTTSALRFMVSGGNNVGNVGLVTVNPTYVFVQIWGDT